MLPKTSLKQLFYFVAVAETEKINSAALMIPISASVLTETIKQLEYQFGVQLFERKRDGMKLTYAGFQLLEQARTILRLTEEANEIIGKTETGYLGSINLCVTPAVMGYFLPSIFARFRRVFPNIQINIYECERVELEDRLKNNSTELALMLVSNLTLKKHKIHVKTLLHSKRNLWCSSTHPFTDLDSIDVKILKNETFIMPYLDEAHINLLSYLQKQKVQPKEIISTQTTEAVRSLVANSSGVTILSDLLYRPWSLEGAKLVRRKMKQPVPSMNLGIVWSKSMKLSSIDELFVDFLERECQHIYLKQIT